MKQNVRQRVTIHDRYQVELKVEYQLLPSHSTRYTITTYFFIPQTLGINEITYPTGEFYRRTQNYIRLRTPQFTPQALLTDPTSPLCIIETILQDRAWLDDAHTHRRLADQFKFLRAILRRSLEQSLRRQWRKTTKDHPNADEAMINLFRDHLVTIETILTRYRHCGARLVPRQSDADLWESYQLTDEALSLVVEENLLQAMVLTERQDDPTIQTVRQQFVLQSELPQEVKDQLVQTIQSEVDYRRQHNYQSILSLHSDNERYLYRISALKKYTSSVLYLGTALSREGATAEHFLFALVAGIAMTFATVVAFYVQALYGAFTFPVFMALVVGYMFKDRIKEAGRSLSLRFLHTHFYDRRIDIRTLQESQRLGHMREKTFFVKANELPPRIIQERNQGTISVIDNGAQGEEVLCYTRDVTLHTHMFQQLYKDGPPITGVADILRLDVRPFLHKMDDPIALRLGLDGKQVRSVKCAKVYYMNVVSVYTVGDAKEPIIAQRVRLTLNRKGLVRLQTMGD